MGSWAHGLFAFSPLCWGIREYPRPSWCYAFGWTAVMIGQSGKSGSCCYSFLACVPILRSYLFYQQRRIIREKEDIPVSFSRDFQRQGFFYHFNGSPLRDQRKMIV